MKQYLNLLQAIRETGAEKGDRTGTGTLSIFGHQMRFDLREGFPILTTKKMFLKGVITELLWFIKGDTNTKFLEENGVHFWKEWADDYGDLGPIYGKQLRHPYFVPDMIAGESVLRRTDQLSEVIRGIKTNPNSRRHVVTMWRPEDLPSENLSPQQNVAAGKMALATCHGTVIQFYVSNRELSCSTYQRSADAFLGLPVNIASYALLTHMIAQQCGLNVGELIYTTGDTHLYLNHLEQVQEQLTRSPKDLPPLVLNRKPESIFDYKIEDFGLIGYAPLAAIKAEVSV
jgi:thymidylate synthase